MKVTKGKTGLDNEVIAFYTGTELVFRSKHTSRNFLLSNESFIYVGSAKFEDHLELSKVHPGFIAFYKGDTINIEL